MNSSFYSRLKKIISISVIIFFVMFVFRIIYGYSKPVGQVNNGAQFFESVASSQRNYASKSYKMKSNGANLPSAGVSKVDQKYEKIAEVETKSNEFETEEKSARSKIVKYNSIIQFEQKKGNAGYRKLQLLIGVPPENFDALYADLIQIGNVQAKQITKKDKTNEYKELSSKKSTLTSIRNSLIDLKGKSGKIEEFVQLENRILEIEQQLQGLGVNLGDFDNENEFCTVKFSLNEGKEVKISFIHRVKVALEWTIKFYLRLMSILFLVTGFVYLGLLIIDKLKILSKRFNG